MTTSPSISISSVAEWKEAFSQAQPGSILTIQPGTYREPLTVDCHGEPDNPIRIQAATPGTVILSGAERLTDWKNEGKDRWKTPFEITAEQRLEPHFGYITLPLQLWMDDSRLLQVKNREKLCPKSFCYEDGIIWLQLEPGNDANAVSLEASRHATMLTVTGSHLEIKGLTVTRCANSMQIGGANFLGPNNLIENCIFSEASAGVGVHFDGHHNIIRGNEIHHNGQIGFALVASNVLFEENYVHDNDVRNFCGHPEAEWQVWESGGGKVAYARDCVFRNNRFIDNRFGPGLWFDIDNYRNRIEGNTFSGNGHSAIMMEISWDNLICNNIICDTHESNYSAAGILVQLSCRTRIYHNLILRCEGYGVHLRWHVRVRDIHPYEPLDPEEFFATHGFRQEDWMPADGQYPVNENDIRNNVFVDCRRGAIQYDVHPEFTRGNTSDYNFFWNRHNLHPMAGGHRLLEWQEMTGLDQHSYYDKMAHYGPLLTEANGKIEIDPESPLNGFSVPRIDEVSLDVHDQKRGDPTLPGPFLM
jgi:parallel beta-helix repeat protein